MNFICNQCINRLLCCDKQTKKFGCKYFNDEEYFKELLYTWSPATDWNGILSMIDNIIRNDN